jgi:hypothetical protein
MNPKISENGFFCLSCRNRCLGCCRRICHDDGRFGRNFRPSEQKEDRPRQTGIQCPELPVRANTQPAPDSEKAFGQVKMKTSRKNNECSNRRSFYENLRQSLSEFCRDLQEHSTWKYEDSPPFQLLVKSELHKYSTHPDELARADWFWSRRPRRLSTVCWILWVSVALGLPIWLFVFPCIGVPLLIIAVVIANVETVRFVRWRRQYESSIDRLIRISTRDRNSLGGDVYS